MTLHLVGLPHTPFDAHIASSCAFTAKAVRTVGMWRQSGHDVTVYWGGGLGDVSCLSVLEQNQWFGEWDPTELPKVGWDSNLPYWQMFHRRAIDAIAERIQPGDIVAGLVGSIHQQVFDAFTATHTCIEPGVGYEGLAAGTFACFESNAWMHHTYGRYGINDGRFFDTVIPNAVDPDDWDLGEDHGYALFVGRCIARKGIAVAADIADRAGLELKVAGAGVREVGHGYLVCADGTVARAEEITYVGAVTGDDRRKLFANASVLIMPTLYVEPYGNVHVEAMMSGVGCVTTDFGVFTETVPDGYRFRTMSEAVDAVHLARSSRGITWRDHAMSFAAPDICRAKYDRWFDRLASLRDGRNGFYS